MTQYAITDEEKIARIADVCPRAMSSYFIVLYKCSNGEHVISRKDIVHGHSKSWTKFKNDLRELSKLFIVNFFDDGHCISVSMVEDQ